MFAAAEWLMGGGEGGGGVCDGGGRVERETALAGLGSVNAWPG